MTHKLPGSAPAQGPRRRLGLLALGLYALSACVQTDPADPGAGSEPRTPPEDPGRLTGASSSTNWPADIAQSQRFATWSSDPDLVLRFFDFPPVFPPAEVPAKLKGTLHFYPGQAIPAFAPLPKHSFAFAETESLRVDMPAVLAALSASTDTVSLNIHIDLDSLGGWIHGLRFDRATGRIIASPDSATPEKRVILKEPKYYFQGSVPEVTSLLPVTAGTKPEISFYIPGSPYFCKAQSDSFHVGPLPRQAYPLRVIRTSASRVDPGGTLVEIWELRVAGIGVGSTFTLGGQVLSYSSEAKFALRDKE